jgi:hypothetical protein
VDEFGSVNCLLRTIWRFGTNALLWCFSELSFR